MSSVSTVSTNNNDNNFRNAAIGATGVAVAWEAEPYLKKGILFPVRKYIKPRVKAIQGGGYLPYVEKAVKQHKLEKDFKVLDLNYATARSIRKTLEMDSRKVSPFQKLLCHILRVPCNMERTFKATLNGQNAFFSPRHNAIVCNFDKFGAPAFHEISHKLNSKSSNILVKTLSKIRNPLAVFGTLGVSACAIFTDPKKENEKPVGVKDFVKQHCGLMATTMMLPLTIEEFIANSKGTKVAKQAGVTGELLKKVKKSHKISNVSYITGAIATGLAVQAASVIRDAICAQKQK